ncbi:hypothetical protein EV1_022165 [Malus domestica]
MAEAGFGLSGDSTMVLAALRQHDDDSSNLGAGLNDAKHFMHLFPHVQLNHAQREAKKCGTEIGEDVLLDSNSV